MPSNEDMSEWRREERERQKAFDEGRNKVHEFKPRVGSSTYCGYCDRVRDHELHIPCRADCFCQLCDPNEVGFWGMMFDYAVQARLEDDTTITLNVD
jgi:hypothetical protein